MLKPVRRLIVKGYKKDGSDMNFQVGQEVYGGHIICGIHELDNGDRKIYIEKDGAEKLWKNIGQGVACIAEYEI